MYRRATAVAARLLFCPCGIACTGRRRRQTTLFIFLRELASSFKLLYTRICIPLEKRPGKHAFETCGTTENAQVAKSEYTKIAYIQAAAHDPTIFGSSLRSNQPQLGQQSVRESPRYHRHRNPRKPSPAGSTETWRTQKENRANSRSSSPSRSAGSNRVYGNLEAVEGRARRRPRPEGGREISTREYL